MLRTKQFFLIASLYLCILQTIHASNVPFGLRPDVYEGLQNIVSLMNRSAYDSAQALIVRQLLYQKSKLNKREEYFLYCYEAEIMYYNGLFEIGLTSAQEARNLANSLENDTLIGSAQNLVGLQYMHLLKYKQAKKSFKNAIELLPSVTDKDLYSQRYHALANLAEVFLYQNNADSAAYFSKLAIAEALSQGSIRGASFSYWSLAESQILNNTPLLARQSSKEGLALLEKEEVEDAHLFLCISMIKVYDALGKADSAGMFLEKGKEYEESLNASDYAKLSFLKFTAKHSLAQPNVEESYNRLNKLEDLRNAILERHEKQRLQVLIGFYKGKEELVKAQYLSENQQKEIELKSNINYVLIILMLLTALLAYFGFRSIKQKQHIIKLKYQAQLQQNQAEMEIVAIENKLNAIHTERNRIASDLHDDVGAALSSIHIYSSVALSKQMQGKVVVELLSKITQASTSLLERMSDIIWSINQENGKLRDLKLRIKAFAADLLFPCGIVVIYNFEDADDELALSASARKNIYLTFKEAINNLAKHANASKVTIGLKCTAINLECYVVDDGVGFDPANTTKGNGMYNLKRRVGSLNGEFYINTGPYNGTEIRFIIPLTNISD